MAVKLPIYLDNHATTKVDPRVAEAMLPYFSEHYGNAASKQHQFGWAAQAAVEHARGKIARLIDANPQEIIFTSGATESINLALKGIAEGHASKGDHIVTAMTEHSAVLDTCKRLERYNYRVTYLPVDSHGCVSLEAVRNAMTDRTIVVTIMLANNEIGTIAPLQEIGALCRQRGVVFHTDATQAVGKIPVNVGKMNIDLMSFSAHKMYGPKGIGALYVSRSQSHLNVVQQIDGGGHERGLRSGTLDVPAIVGFGKACEIAETEMADESVRVGGLRDRFIDGITSRIDGVSVNGHSTARLPNNANLTFAHVNADRLMMDMKEIAVSTGSACSSASPEASHVLKAIGLSDESIHSSLRFGLGRFTTEEEVDYVIQRIADAVKAERAKALRYQGAER
jgi:cysteine desulfurase